MYSYLSAVIPYPLSTLVLTLPSFSLFSAFPTLSVLIVLTRRQLWYKIQEKKVSFFFREKTRIYENRPFTFSLANPVSLPCTRDRAILLQFNVDFSLSRMPSGPAGLFPGTSDPFLAAYGNNLWNSDEWVRRQWVFEFFFWIMRSSPVINESQQLPNEEIELFHEPRDETEEN